MILRRSRSLFVGSGSAVLLAVLLVTGFFANSASAAPWTLSKSALPLAIGRDWWLPTNYSEHGKQMDVIFLVIFWITTVIFFGVQGFLVYFLIKYRGRPDKKKGIFSHGNTRLEMLWTAIPAVILIVISLWTKRVWDNYRYNPAVANDPNLVKVLVIGQQFKWNVVYPGPDGELGRYLMYPKTTDLKWPAVPAGKNFSFPRALGPAYLPEEQARLVLNNYIESVNPLGKDFDDPAGKDDDFLNALNRAVEVPKGRSVEINIGSRDVLHDFFLPNFRVKLDAVPGMRGKLYLVATTSCKELQPAARTYTLAELETLVKQNKEVIAIVDEADQSRGAEHVKRARPRPSDYWRFAKDGETVLRDGNILTLDVIKDLRTIGVKDIRANQPFYWDLVCEELCGAGHSTMGGKFIVLDDEQMKQEPYTKYFKPLPPRVALKTP